LNPAPVASDTCAVIDVFPVSFIVKLFEAAGILDTLSSAKFRVEGDTLNLPNSGFVFAGETCG
jgi:hypothetical protein